MWKNLTLRYCKDTKFFEVGKSFLNFSFQIYSI